MQKGSALTVNGKPHRFSEGMTVSSLLAELLAPQPDRPAAVVVEVNGTIIPRERFDATQLAAGDTIEVVHFVGGG